MGHVEVPEPEGMRGRVLDRMEQAAILECYGPLNRAARRQDATDD